MNNSIKTTDKTYLAAKAILEGTAADESVYDIPRLKSIVNTLSSAVDDLYKLEKLADISKDPKLSTNKKNLLSKIDKYHKLFSEVYKIIINNNTYE